MKKRIWLKIPGFKLRNIRREGEKICFDAELGDEITVQRIRVEGKSLNLNSTNFSFLDVPMIHVRKRNPVLIETIGLALEEIYFQGSQRGELEFAKPEEWEGKSLRIPVDFVQFKTLGSEKGAVYTNIYIGHHLAVLRIPIFNGTRFLLESSNYPMVHNKKILEMIKNLVKRPQTRGNILETSRNGMGNPGFSVLTGIKGCDPEDLPPSIRIY